jgi:hypothetical protein
VHIEKGNLLKLGLIETSVVFQSVGPKRTPPEGAASGVHCRSGDKGGAECHRAVLHQRQLCEVKHHMLHLHPHEQSKNTIRHLIQSFRVSDDEERTRLYIATSLSPLPAAFANRTRKTYIVGTVRFHSILFRMAFSIPRICRRLYA